MMDSESIASSASIVITVIVAVLFFMIGGHIGSSGMKAIMMEEAVKHGKAEFYLDDNNERKWRWKP